MKLKTKIIAHLITVVLYIIATYIAFKKPEMVKLEVDYGGRTFGFWFSSIVYIIFSILWYNEERALKLGFLFKLKEYDPANITYGYEVFHRIGLYLALLFTSVGIFYFM